MRNSNRAVLAHEKFIGNIKDKLMEKWSLTREKSGKLLERESSS
jgi:hypothetical protein